MNDEDWKIKSSGLIVPEHALAGRKEGDRSRRVIDGSKIPALFRRWFSAKSWATISQIITTLIAVLALILSIRTEVNQDRQGEAAIADKVAITYKGNTAQDQRYEFYNYSSKLLYDVHFYFVFGPSFGPDTPSVKYDVGDIPPCSKLIVSLHYDSSDSREKLPYLAFTESGRSWILNAWPKRVPGDWNENHLEMSWENSENTKELSTC